MSDTETAATYKSLTQMTEEVVANNREKGWHDNPPSLPECMMMLVTEAAEAVEAWRIWGIEDGTAGSAVNPGGDKGAKPEGVGSELADILIRLLDDCYLFGVDLESEFNRKMAYNRMRPFRHGGKRI